MWGQKLKHLRIINVDVVEYYEFNQDIYNSKYTCKLTSLMKINVLIKHHSIVQRQKISAGCFANRTGKDVEKVQGVLRNQW